jgi:hypothetical protein
MKINNLVASALVISYAIFGGVALATPYSPVSALTPTTGEVWFVGSTTAVSNSAFSDTYSFSFNAPATLSFTAVGGWGTTFGDYKAQWIGTAPSGSVLTHTDTANEYGDTWSGSFTAVAGTIYSLKIFQDINASPYGYHQFTLTGTAVAAVPEPETFAMLLAGLGLIGALTRRRNRVELAT